MNGTRFSQSEQPNRRRCPTCGAPRGDQSTCHRCRSNLEMLVELEGRVDDLAARAQRLYARGWYRQAALLAARVVSLERSPEHLALLACARLMSGDFPAAAEVCRQVGRT